MSDLATFCNWHDQRDSLLYKSKLKVRLSHFQISKSKIRAVSRTKTSNEDSFFVRFIDRQENKRGENLGDSEVERK